MQRKQNTKIINWYGKHTWKKDPKEEMHHHTGESMGISRKFRRGIRRGEKEKEKIE